MFRKLNKSTRPSRPLTQNEYIMMQIRMHILLSTILLFFSYNTIKGQDNKSEDMKLKPEKQYSNQGIEDRTDWIKVLTRIADPVLLALSETKLKETMPVECAAGREEYAREVTHLEAFGRVIAGIAPWLELGADETQEGKLRKKYIDLAIRSLINAVDPDSPDFMNFNRYAQPLVDAAFLAHALIRSPRELWGNLNSLSKKNLVAALKSTRVIKPYYSNWLLFSAMVEAALLKFDGNWDAMRVDYALRQHELWYKGDGIYGDGPEFHFDYYNSFVIQPMMLDIIRTMEEMGQRSPISYEVVLQRAKRYAAIQERLISPEGTFPAIGRSLAYRFGAFQLLGQIALMHELPDELHPASVRSALTAVIKQMIQAPGTFDENGWLKIGFCGHQPAIGESYISTGSLYLCTVGLLPLGLPENDKFWTTPAMDWTAKRIWSGKDEKADHALKQE